MRDVESLREHYALTLGHWAERLESSYEAVRELVDEATYRIWQLMTYGSRYNFEQGQYNLYQTLLVKPEMGRSYLPLTRADWYA